MVKRVKPSILVGVSTQKEAFTEEVTSRSLLIEAQADPLWRRQIVRGMAKSCDHPIILPLSNPTKLTEVTPENVEKWTDGKGLCAAGSPFDPIKKGGKDFPVGEANNVRRLYLLLPHC